MSSKTKTTATQEEATPSLVPKLRFPEFRGAEAWKEKPLKAAAEINPANGGLPESFVYIDLESVDAGELKAKERISRVRAPSRAQRRVEHGDIIYQVVRPYQRNNLLCEFPDNENYVASTGYAQLRAKGSNRYLYQSIHTDSFVGRVIAKCTGSNYPAINSSDLAEIHLPIPPTLLEQQKIAECLSSADELIAAQARKVDALKTHKKGLMQQLFPREGETQPRLRFPEFQNAGEWEETTLGELAKLVRGPFGGSLKKEIFVASGYAVYEQQHAIYSNFSFFRYHITAEKFRELMRFAVAANDVIMSCSGTMGKFAIVPDGAAPGVINQALLKLTPHELCNTNFLKELLELPSVQQKLLAQSAGGAIQNVVAVDQIKALPLRLPSADEQKAVVGCRRPPAFSSGAV